MSELINQEPININISNSTSSNGQQSFLSRILDIGLKILIPLAVLFGIALIYLIITVVIPFFTDVTTTLSDALGGNAGRFLQFAFGPVGTLVGGIGTLTGWVVGR